MTTSVSSKLTTVLIANRGEIARRIARTARMMGLHTIGLVTAPDRLMPHAAEMDRLIDLEQWRGTGEPYADLAVMSEVLGLLPAGTAVHPGYGFLAENATFAHMVSDADMVWVGPKPSVIEQMGSKINARAIAETAGVATIPGYSESQVDGDLCAAAERIGWPVLVKASAGGGGKGIRIARASDEFEPALHEARSEALRAFGDDRVIVERYIERPRHIEVQIMGDHHGRVVDLGTRECSVQRRYQKLFEEAPAPNLPDDVRAAIRGAAVKLAESVGYDSAGTVEFVVDAATHEWFFLEMNTRLQVEHCVTEQVTGVDLVELMFQSAMGEPLSLADPITITGHALEARIAAEDPTVDFVPQIGTVHHVVVPSEVRWDAAVEPGSTITPHFDSMIAKLIVTGSSRPDAITKMRTALDGLVIGGLVTTAGLHRWLVDHPMFVDAAITTRFLDETRVPAMPAPPIIQAARVWRDANRTSQSASPWSNHTGFSLTPHQPRRPIGVRHADEVVEVTLSTDGVADGTGGDQPAARATASVVDQSTGRVSITVNGTTFHFEMLSRTERWAATLENRRGTGDALVAPFPAVVAEVNVAPGDVVAGGQVLVVIEAMKMLHSLKATGAGIVDAVPVAVGDQVSTDQPLVTFTEDSPEEASP